MKGHLLLYSVSSLEGKQSGHFDFPLNYTVGEWDPDRWVPQITSNVISLVRTIPSSYTPVTKVQKGKVNEVTEVVKDW